VIFCHSLWQDRTTLFPESAAEQPASSLPESLVIISLYYSAHCAETVSTWKGAVEKMKRFIYAFAFLACLSTLTGVIYAQTAAATINGTVTDSAGATVADAQITITNQGTTTRTTTNTTGDGSFSMTGLASGTYDVTVTKTGFQTYTEKNLYVGPATTRTVNASLTVGQVTSQVTVEAAAVQVQTTTAQFSSNVAQQQVETLPLNGRNYQSLSALMPGVANLNVGNSSSTGQGGFNTSNSMSINGMGTSGTLYLLDGVWNMNTGNMTQTTIMPNPDSISEVRTLQNNVSPKYTLLGASSVLVATRSGTHDFHGALWEYFRNDALDARNFFSPTVLSEKQNIFGGTIGGPLFIPKLWNTSRDKTFFFISEQGVIRHLGSTQTGLTPTAAQRNGCFSSPIKDPSTGQNFPVSNGCYQIPTNRINPNSLTLLNSLAELPNYSSSGNNYINTNPETINQLDSQIKVDHNVGEKVHLMGEFFDLRQTDNLPSQEWASSPFTTNKQNFTTRSKLAELQGTVILSPTMVNQISIGLNDYVVDLGITGLVYKNQLPNFQSTLPYNGLLSERLPLVNFSGGYSSIGVTQTQPLTHASDVEETLTDDWSWLRGNHFIEAGFNYVHSIKRQNQFAQSNGTWTFSGRFTGDPIADYLLGTAAQFTQQSGERRPYMFGNIVSPYVQDTWKVRKNFTLNYGVRITYMPLPHATLAETIFNPAVYNRSQAPIVNADGTITPTANYNPLNGLIQNGVNGVPVNFSNNNQWYVGPQAGFAWDIKGNGKTSLRGGYGITYTRVFTGGDCSYSCANNYPYIQSLTLTNPPFPSPLGPGVTSVNAAPNLNSQDLNVKASSVYTYSLSLEHQFAGGWLVSATGAGNVVRNMPLSLDYNQPFPSGGYDFNPSINTGTYQYLYGPYPGWGGISTVSSRGNAYWNGLLLSVRHAAGHGLFITGSYTYAHGLQNGFTSSGFDSTSIQNSYNLNGDYGNSSVDIRHLFSLSYIWNIPFMQNATGFKKALLGGWRYSGITTVQSGIALNPGLSVTNQGLATRPNVVSGQSLTYPKTVNEWFNPAAFAAPAYGFFGNAGQGILRGPGLVNFDMAGYKDFHITERQTIEFRGELFNIFNHTNFSGVNTTFGSAQFGKVTSALDPRIVEFALRYHF
jgi:hypothetical protein